MFFQYSRVRSGGVPGLEFIVRINEFRRRISYSFGVVESVNWVIKAGIWSDGEFRMEGVRVSSSRESENSLKEGRCWFSMDVILMG